MAKVQLTGAFARFRGKLNKSEVLVLKGCPCGKEQMAMDLLNPSKANHANNVLSQNALKTAAQAAKTKRQPSKQVSLTKTSTRHSSPTP